MGNGVSTDESVRLKAEVFEAIVDDLRAVLRLAHGRTEEPSAAMFDSRALQSSPESGHRAGYDGAKRRKGSKVHLAVDTLGHLLALHVTPVNEQDRAQVRELAGAVQEVTGHQDGTSASTQPPSLREALCFLAYRGQGQHETVEIVLQHFECHLIIEVIKFALGCNLHADNERLEQLENNRSIASKPLVGVCAIREVDHM
jgi:hypothetical protein